MISSAAKRTAICHCIHPLGTEGTYKLDHWQQERQIQIAAAGADLIIGDHPMCCSPLATREMSMVSSLGNYLFNSKTLDSCLVGGGDRDEGGIHCGLFRQSELPRGEGGRREEKERIINYTRSISPEAVM